MAQEETIFLIGESRTNVDNAITKVYGSFYIAFEVEPSSGRIVEVDCSRTLDLTREFIRKIFVGRLIYKDSEAIEAEVKRRYYGSSSKAILVAYRDVLKRYIKLMDSLSGRQQDEYEGKCGVLGSSIPDLR